LFLAQQAIEKCIKAVLAMNAIVYRRTHDLLLLESPGRRSRSGAACGA
jgi:HEPN domain-containing protein